MDPQKLSARELVQLCLESRDEAMWKEFVRRFQPMIAGVIVKRLLRHPGHKEAGGVVDDLVQDTFLKICINDFKALRAFNFQHENALYAFLKVVASHVVEDYFRNLNSRKRGSGRGEESLEEIPSTLLATSDPAETLDHGIMLDEIKECLQDLATDPNFHRDHSIFWLYYHHGLTAKAIAELPGINLGVKGVESTLLRMTRLVRSRLNFMQRKRKASG
jgi:RNA polymerase sigma-70 factor (ECF subfamily)